MEESSARSVREVSNEERRELQGYVERNEIEADVSVDYLL